MTEQLAAITDGKRLLCLKGNRACRQLHRQRSGVDRFKKSRAQGSMDLDAASNHIVSETFRIIRQRRLDSEHQNSLCAFVSFVSSWLTSRGVAVNVYRVPIGCDVHLPVPIGTKNLRAHVAVPLKDFWRGMTEVIGPANAEHRDRRTEGAQEFRRARGEAAVV